MKKLYFILSILALTMFVGCQNSTDGTGNGNTSSGGDDTPMTYTLVGEKDDAAKYVLANLPTTDNPSKYAKGDTVTFSIKTKNSETPTELYLVKITVKERYTSVVLDRTITYNKENHTVSFTMPDNDVMVRADFEDVVCRPFDFNSDVSQRPNRLDVDYIGKDSFRVALRFDNKEYDNLEPFGEGKFIYEFYNLESARVGSRWYFYIQLGNDYNVYDYENPENCKYHETPVVIYNDTMYEPVIGSNLGNRYVNLDAKLNQN